MDIGPRGAVVSGSRRRRPRSAFMRKPLINNLVNCCAAIIAELPGRFYGGTMQLAYKQLVTELAEAGRRVLEFNAHVDEQRQLIEKLAAERQDITSAQTVFDSLLISVFLYVQERHRLYMMLNDKAAQSDAA